MHRNNLELFMASLRNLPRKQHSLLFLHSTRYLFCASAWLLYLFRPQFRRHWCIVFLRPPHVHCFDTIFQPPFCSCSLCNRLAIYCIKLDSHSIIPVLVTIFLFHAQLLPVFVCTIGIRFLNIWYLFAVGSWEVLYIDLRFSSSMSS